jgi:tRNA (guanine37-N1)-methyltransferase
VIEILRRRLTARDAGEVLTIQRAAFLSEAQVYGTTEIPPLLESFEEVCEAIESTFSFGAFFGPRLVGAIRLSVDASVGWISRVAVAPDQQGQGIASGLLTMVEREAPEHVSEFRLLAGSRSKENLSMYERRGFVEFDRVIDDAGIELVVLRKVRGAQIR